MLTHFWQSGYFSIYSLMPSLFTLEVMIIVSLLLRKCDKRKHFALRGTASVVATVLYCLFAPMSRPSSDLYLLWVFLEYTGEFVLAVLLVWYCFKIRFTHVIFIGVMGFCAQNIANNMVTSILYAFRGIRGGAWTAIYLTVFIATFAAAFFVLYKIYMKKTDGDILIKISNWQIVVFVIATLAVANFLNMFLPNAIPPGLKRLGASAAVVICDVMIILLQITVLMNDRITLELKKINELWEKDRMAYEHGREKLDSLSLQIHDMKHLLIKLEKGEADEVREKLLMSIKEYDGIVDTGNKALNVVINEKNKFCLANGIDLTVIADGKCLDFIGSIDIYTLLGNMLDNAIEGVMKIEEPDKRIISLLVSRSNGSVIIREDNCYNGKVSFKNGLPVTTKFDKNQHGYGSRSIGLIVKKYGGSCSFSVEKGIFSLEITFPINQ